MKHFEVESSETVYQGRAFRVRKDVVRLPNGKTTTLDIVQHTGAVTMLPYDNEGKIWFVRQYRHAARQVLLELPAGTLEEDEPPIEAAARELKEEIGMTAGELKKIGEFYMVPGYSSECMHVFLATQLSPESLERDPDEFINVEVITAQQAYKMIESGEIRDAKTIAGLLLAKPYLNI